MAYEREIFIPVQSSIYTSESQHERSLRIVYSIPTAGTNDETGILCLIPGYGGNINSNVYHKMRQQFADNYNMVVLQCDYFGIQFMSSFSNEFEKYIKKEEIYSINKNEIITDTEPDENWTDCNDMGVMQAMDIIATLLWFIRTAMQKNIRFNSSKIIAYGSSHGCYLSYLVNRMCPGLLKVIVDNSAYIYPVYLNYERYLKTFNNGQSTTRLIKYLVMREPNMRLPKEFYNLSFLYKDFQNECRIISFHGIEDSMISISKKKEFINQLGNNAALIPIYPSDVDNVIFKNAGHGLGIDLIELYNLIDSRFPFSKSNSLTLPNSIIIVGKHDCLEITYENLYPHLQWYKHII